MCGEGSPCDVVIKPLSVVIAGVDWSSCGHRGCLWALITRGGKDSDREEHAIDGFALLVDCRRLSMLLPRIAARGA